jgi:hypothetical protein
MTRPLGPHGRKRESNRMIQHGRFPFLLHSISASLFLVAAVPAYAVQIHSGPEGLYAHQISHVFFASSMGLLVYWLRQRQLVKEPGWHLIQYAAIFFILWNFDSMLAHYLDDRVDLYARIDAATLQGKVSLLKGPRELIVLYYAAKMDHLWSVPAIVLLYLGLKQLVRPSRSSDHSQGAA